MRIVTLVLSIAVAASGQPYPAPDSAAAAYRPADPARAVALFVPQQFFADDEYEPLARRFANAGLQVAVVSADTGVAVSTGHLILNPALSLGQLRAEDFAALVLVGGPGMVLHWGDSLLHERCREFSAAGKTVAAIGIAPITLARSGVLKGRTATVYNDRAAVAELKSAGARHSFRTLVNDRGIITAAGASRAGAVADAVARTLGGKR
jgi:protease I